MKITMTLLLLFFNAKAELLTLDDAIAMALQSHPDMQASALRHESSKADTKAARAALYPRIDLNGEYYPTKTVVMPSNGTLSTRQTDAFHADVSGSYPLWDFGRNGHITQAAKYNEEGAASEETSAENSIIEQVWLRYTTISYVEKLIDTAQKSAEFYEAQYTKAVKMREVGLKTHADESRFKASWLEADEHLSAARAEKEKALMALRLLVGSDETVTIDEADFDRHVNAITATVKDIKILRQELSQHNPQLQTLRAHIDRTKALSEATAKQPYGTVALVASYGYDNSLASYNTSQIGVKGSIPLYDGGKMSADGQKSRILLTLAQKEYESAEKSLWQELYGAVVDLNRLDQTIAAKEGVMNATQKALSLMEGRYTQGLATYIDILESQSVLESSRISHAEAKLQKIRAWVQIRRLLNKGNDHGML